MTKKQVLSIVAPYSWSTALVPLTMTALFCIYKNLSVDIDLFIAVILSGILGQSFINIINYYSDFKSELDNKKTIFNTEGSILVHDKVAEKEVILLGFGILLISSIPLLYLMNSKGFDILIISLIGFVLGILYSIGPLPLSTTPFGEVYSGLLDGFFLSVFSYYIYTDLFSSDILVLALPTVLWVISIAFTSSICNIEKDKEHRTTLAIYLGKVQSITLLKFIYFGMFICQLINIYLELIPVTTILTIFTVPFIIKNLNEITEENTTVENKFSVMEKSCGCGELFFYIFFLTFMASIFVERV